MHIALAQFNPTVGDIAGNARRILDLTSKATSSGARLIIFPELSVIGYAPGDLLDNAHTMDAVEAALQWMHERMPDGVALVVGAPVRNKSQHGKRLYNAAVVLEKGKKAQHVYKMLLPTYDVYDEYRYFEPATHQKPVVVDDLRLGIHICEDMWNLAAYSSYHTYEADPIQELVSQGVDLLINLSASPYSHARHDVRTSLIKEICAEHHLPFVLVNQVGANAELIFDGDSRVQNAEGDIVALAPSFGEHLLYWDTENQKPLSVPPRNRIAELHKALVTGIKEYYRKTDVFDKALIGLSGGIDSAVTAALAVDALGADRVWGVTMPSVHSSKGSVDDSVALAKNLGFTCDSLPIKKAVDAFTDLLSGHFKGTPSGIAEENIQARSRGLALMALSNKFNHFVLATGNKSEFAMGYATLYGDMAGGLAVLADVFKTDVYALAEYMNEKAGMDRIPRNTIDKAPSAELRPDQKDEDSLPPYPVLDEILRLYIEERLDADAIVTQSGYDLEFVTGLLNAVDRNEYKRKQAPPGLRVSKKAFGTGRRMPIVARYDRIGMSRLIDEAFTTESP